MKKIIFLMLCVFWGINESWAVTLKCPDVVSPGEEFKINIMSDEYKGLKAKYSFSSGFVYRGINIGTKWKSYYDGIDGFSIGNVTNNEKLGLDIEVMVNNDVELNKEYILSLVDIEASDINGKNIKMNDLFCKVKLLADVNTLDSLVVEGVELSPEFEKRVFSYRGVTKKASVFIKANPSDKAAKVDGDIGEQKLNLGVNTFNIKVTSVRGNVQDYKIYITREVKSNEVALKSLKLSNGSLKYKSDVFFYSLDVGYDVDNIVVEAIPVNDKALVKIEKTDMLVVGENIIKVVVTAEDGTIATYVIVVNRKDKLSGDASIKSLVVKNYEIEFKSDIYEYDLVIDGEEKLDIEVTLNSEKSSYNIKGNKNLKNNSIIEVEVTAEDGSISVYKINIKKYGKSNSNSVVNYIRIVPLICLVLFVGLILTIKLIKIKVVKFNK